MKRDDLEIFFSNIISALKTEEEKARFTKYFYNSFLAGDTVLYQKNIAEFKNFDNEWITTLESYLPSIDKIIKSPKSTLKYDEEIIIIEKAKKVTSTSIRHLAANSHLIKDVDEDGDIIPKKILSSQAEVEYAIYENRFIMTLIQRLSKFVGNRYEVIKSNIESFQRTHLNITSNFDINSNNVNLSLDMVVKSEAENNALKQRNEALLDRVTKMVRNISGYMNSPFMRELAGKKPVTPPIMKTNIILKNPDFRNAYNLWLFLDRYNALVYDIDVQEKDLELDPSYINNINQLALLTYAFVMYNQESRKEEYAKEDMVHYVRKATKIIRTHPRDVVNDPDGIAMEDNTVNEYYLDQNQRLFKKSLSELLGEDISYEDALKKAMTQTMDITNSLYKSVFELNPAMRAEVDDVFEKTDLEKELEEARKRAEIARIIRETKEQDYKETIELEKDQLKEIGNINSEIIRQKAEKRKLAKEKAKREKLSAEVKESRSEKAEAKEGKKILQKSIEEISEIKQTLELEQKEINKKLIDQANKALIAAEKEKAKIERAEELARLKAERKLAIQKERELFREHRTQIRAKYKDLQKSIIENEKIARQVEIDKLHQKYKMIKEQELEKVRLRMMQ